jgi:hypothetical protein
MNQVQEIRRAYILARALNVQYQFIREMVNGDLKKSINEAKAKNAHFIKLIDDQFAKNNLNQNEFDEELAFKLLEEIEKL